MLTKTSLFCLIIIVCSCSNPRTLIENQTAERIYFGNFGGFTNASIDYVLIDNSAVFKIEKSNPVYVTRLTRQQSSQISDLIQKAGIEKSDLNQPGNMTYYIKIVKPGFEKEVKWTDQTVSPDIKELYKSLMSIIKQ